MPGRSIGTALGCRALTLSRLGAALVLGLLALATGPAVANNSCKPDPACKPQFSLDRYEAGRDVPITDCRTNPSGSACAWADAHSGLENFLACRLETTGPIALCYYSGVPGAALQTPGCTLTQDGKAADCTCYQVSQGKPKGRAVFLHPGHLDPEQAGLRGDRQALRPRRRALPERRQSGLRRPAARGAGLRGDAGRDDVSGADLISTFSPILAPELGLVSQTCPRNGKGGNLYAGCMGSPCKTTGKTDPATGLPLVRCTCPTFDGPTRSATRRSSLATSPAASRPMSGPPPTSIPPSAC